MSDEMPAGYRNYLGSIKPELVGTIEPVILQSVADGVHGVYVRGMPDEIQAMVSEDVPYGEVRVEHYE